MNLEGKKVLLTGGVRRIGAFIAREFATAGAVVVLHCRVLGEDAEALLKSLPGSGHVLLPPADFERPGTASKLFAAAVKSVGKIDVLINNASAYRLQSDFLTERYNAVNVAAPLELIEHFAKQKTPGVIVNVLDQEVLHKTVKKDPYTQSRLEMLQETKRLALELAEQNVRVNAVAPGPMIPPVGLEGSKMKKTLAAVPLHRRVEPEDFAKAVRFLCENESITGAVLAVDCGQSLK